VCDPNPARVKVGNELLHLFPLAHAPPLGGSPFPNAERRIAALPPLLIQAPVERGPNQGQFGVRFRGTGLTMSRATMARPRSLKQRKQYGLRLDPQLMREIEHLSVDQQKYLNELTEEAFRDLLKKYREKSRGK
jgi:hypothetical protein